MLCPAVIAISQASPRLLRCYYSLCNVSRLQFLVLNCLVSTASLHISRWNITMVACFCKVICSDTCCAVYQDVAETQTKISTTPYQQVPADQPPTAPMSMEALSKKNLERQPTGPTAAGASPSSGLRPPLAPSKPAPSAAKPPLPPPPSGGFRVTNPLP